MAESSSVPDHMTVVDGVRVRKDDEKRFRATHKAVLAPSAEPAPVRGPVKRRKPAESDDE